MSDKPKIPFEKLTRKEKKALFDAVPLGLVEVNTSWWEYDHWEIKDNTDFFDEAFYRIKEQ